MSTMVSMLINGDAYKGDVQNRTLLIDFIREIAELKGTHTGCSGEGRCGNCTVIVDGKATKSCMMLAVQAEGSKILTVEALANEDGTLHPIQNAFWEKHGVQCGFCTAGMLMTVYEFLSEPRDEYSDEEIREAISGVLCPCTGYIHIIDAIKFTIEELKALSIEDRKSLFSLSEV
jgi:aerobic carbon-monoxide dehydrogenase small subunit